jgi:hypothetical protein
MLKRQRQPRPGATCFRIASMMCAQYATQLVGDGQEQCVGLRDGLVLPELLNGAARLSGVARGQRSPGLLVDEADLALAWRPKVA